jgi:preprotein translocase subunit SecG
MGFLVGLANVLMVLTSLFLICLILIQRGKGGGLAGAFGGVGGSSAFGTKAGDVFTRVTIYVAFVWFVLAICLVWSSSWTTTSAFSKGVAGDSSTADDAAGARSGTKAKDKGEAVPPINVPPVTPTEPSNPGKAGLESTTNAPPVAPVTPPAAPDKKP